MEYYMFAMIALLSVGHLYGHIGIDSFEQNIAKSALHLSQSAYCMTHNSNWDCITCDSSNKLDFVLEEQNELVIQGYNSETDSLFVSFRGSVNIPNWIDNIQISKIAPYDDNNIQVEKGFYKAYNYLKPDIVNNLQILTAKYNTNRLFITGHSLGASMATLLAYDILTIYTGFQLSYLITFGSPRVGNPAFASSFTKYNKGVSYRITHYYDIVPHVPEELFGYLHLSNEIWFNEENTHYAECNDSGGEDPSCSNSCSPIHCTSVSDHLHYMNITMGSDGTC
jgi:predicted lipase